MEEDKPLEWIGSSKDDISAFPDEVKRVMGFALRAAQQGGRALGVKALKDVDGKVLQIADDHDGDTYRATYTVQFPKAVYVLHAFQKKSTKGIETPKREIDVIEARMKRAQQHYKAKYDAEKKNG